MNADSGAPQALLRLRKVSKTYRLDTTQVQALDDVSVDIRQDRFTVLTGPSGSGKTTLLNVAGCLDTPEGGELFIGDVCASALAPDALSDLRANRIGFVFQHFNLLPVLSAYENVELPLLMLGIGAAERGDRVRHMLAQVGLERFVSHLPGQLSGGQRQRVSIARALVKHPDIVLADEPTANLDSANGRAVVALLRTLQRELGAAVVICTHDPALVSEADDVVVLCDGKVTEHRSASDPLRAEGTS
jgi:putative ABC transport system ATP-binding protein